MAEAELDAFEGKWATKYASIAPAWRRAKPWDQTTTRRHRGSRWIHHIGRLIAAANQDAALEMVRIAVDESQRK